MKYKNVIFDLDGTLLDTLKDLCSSVNATLDHFGFPTITLDQCRSYVGNATEYLFRCALGDNADDETLRKAIEFYMPYYKLHSSDETCPYEGITELVKKLKEMGVGIALVSNKPEPVVIKLAEQYFPGMFAAAIGQTERIARKPAPDTVFEAMKILGADKENTVYIGDSEVDITTSKNAGIPCISVTWGFRSREHLIESGAGTIVNNTEELLKALT